MIEEIRMSDMPAVMACLATERRHRGMSMAGLEQISGVSITSMYSWRAGTKSPHLANIISVADTLNFEIILRRVDTESGVPVRIAQDVAKVLDRERRRLRIPRKEHKIVTGVSWSSVAPILYGATSTRLTTIVTVAEALGLEVVLRRK